MDKGSIKCKDGFTQTLDKNKSKGADQFGFSNKQKEGLVTFGNHVAAAVMQQMDGSEQSSKRQRVAHQVDPFAPQLAIQEAQPGVAPESEQRVNVFKRMGEAHLTEKQTKKKAKQDDFIESLGRLTQ